MTKSKIEEIQKDKLPAGVGIQKNQLFHFTGNLTGGTGSGNIIMAPFNENGSFASASISGI